MKNFIKILLVGALVVTGFIFFVGSPSGDKSDNQNASVADVISTESQNLASDHIRTAMKKGAADKTAEKKVAVGIGDFYFEPTVLKVKQGTTITWTNNGMISHDVKSDKNSPKQGPSSELLDRGASYSYTFDEPGLYLYICSPHPTQMRGAIEVME